MKMKWIANVISIIIVIGVITCYHFVIQPTIVNTFEGFQTYHELSDGTWKYQNHIYKYKHDVLEPSDKETNEIKYIILSNHKEITYDESWAYKLLSSGVPSPIDSNDTVIVDVEF